MSSKIKKSQERLFGLILLLLSLAICEFIAGFIIAQIPGVDRSEYADAYKNDPRLTLLTWTRKYHPHPYFGYEDNSIQAFDREKNALSDDTFVVGILGGSVAEMFGNYVIKNSAYQQQLQAAIPQIGDRTLKVVNLAMGGVKQPQQFFIATYYSDDLDLVINIDGFNEFSKATFLPVYPLEFPDLSLKFYERTEGGELYAGLGSLSLFAFKMAARIGLRVPLLSKSSLYFGAWYISTDLLYRANNWSQQAYYSATVGQHQTETVKKSDYYEEKIQIWKRYTAMQHQLIGQHLNKPIYFFLQPNQYLKNSKILSEEEKEHAFDAGVAEQWHRGMALVQQELEGLERQGLPIFDLTPIFSQTPETVYQDACCHLNESGNRIMGENILTAIRNSDSHAAAATDPIRMVEPQSGKLVPRQ